MELKTVLRFEKIKSFNNLNLSNAHVYRYLETPNADSRISNKKLVGSGNVVRDVKRKFEENNISPRKNAVLCVEAVLSLSPEFFKSNGNIKDFAINARKWLLCEFGDTLVSAVLHLDETTPHIHAHIVPLTDDKRLSARELFNKSTLPDFQKSYLNQMKIVEPKLSYNKGSTLEHTSLKNYYSMVNKEIENSCELKVKVADLELEIDNKAEENFTIKNKINMLDKQVKVQKSEISKLSQIIKKLRETISTLSNKENVIENDEYKYQHIFPELNPKNFPDNSGCKDQIKKNKSNNRPRR